MPDLDNAVDFASANNTNTSFGFTESSVRSLAKQINAYRSDIGLPEANFGSSPAELLAKINSSKAITGAANNGANVASTLTNQMITGGLAGGAFRASGIDYRPTTQQVVKLNGAIKSSGYTTNTYGTQYTTDNLANTVGGDTITLTEKKLDFSADESIIAGSTEGSQIITALAALAEDEKLVEEDKAPAVAITTSGTGINPNLVGAIGKIHLGMNRMLGNLRGFASQGQRMVFYMNDATFAAYLSEQDLNGRFQDSQYQFVYANKDTQTYGADFMIGRHGGVPIYIVASNADSGILNTYTVNTAGAITAQTGGNFSAVLAGIPRACTLARLVGNPSIDRVNIWTGANSELSDRNGKITVLGTIATNAGLSIPAFFNYFAVQI
jgi:hypothetical protein